ncbi:isochorismatase family protein [Desulfitibacter alkalitolerans]|uniref:isochorismatase family protein n=1 Tax=Desulfitibacter alkalitolerans TaxID=264641 RepID=UPI000551FF67|nr:isochorismatase family protein [Desulfitibacter alkalitolerans]
MSVYDVFDPKVLQETFKKAREIYKERGFQTRMGYGKKPAIINVDLANAWTREGHAFTCVGADEMVANTRKLLDAARPKKIPIFYSTTAFNPNGFLDNGIWDKKIPLRELHLDTYWAQIDERLDPQPDEIIFVKKMASCFAGTPLQYQLTSLGVDTVIVTGATACACVRHTCMDAIACGFRVIVPEETIGDRIPGAIEWNLFDIDAKFGDVEPLENVIEYINNLT